jgi:hypothetical protein
MSLLLVGHVLVDVVLIAFDIAASSVVVFIAMSVAMGVVNVVVVDNLSWLLMLLRVWFSYVLDLLTAIVR